MPKLTIEPGVAMSFANSSQAIQPMSDWKKTDVKCWCYTTSLFNTLFTTHSPNILYLCPLITFSPPSSSPFYDLVNSSTYTFSPIFGPLHHIHYFVTGVFSSTLLQHIFAIFLLFLSWGNHFFSSYARHCFLSLPTSWAVLLCKFLGNFIGAGAT